MFYFGQTGGGSIMTMGILSIALFQTIYSAQTFLTLNIEDKAKWTRLIFNLSVSFCFLDIWIAIIITGIRNPAYGYVSGISLLAGSVYLFQYWRNKSKFPRLSRIDLISFCFAFTVSLLGFYLKDKFYVASFHKDKCYYYQASSTNYINDHNFPMAKSHALKSLSFNQGDTLRRSLCYKNLGIAEYASEEYYKADSLLNLSLELMLSIDHDQKELFINDIEKHLNEVVKRDVNRK
ncbi:MAG: hypothetical protein AAFY41_09615 [Bacteroidota bacterium]